MMELEGPFSCTFSEHLLFIRSMKMNEALSKSGVQGWKEIHKHMA